MICDKLACKLQFGRRAQLLGHVIQTVKPKAVIRYPFKGFAGTSI